MIKTDNKFDRKAHWENPIAKMVFIPTYEDIELFDQNGYDLTVLEQHYAYANYQKPKKQRDYRFAIKSDWFTQFNKIEGAVLNHSSLFERKGYEGRALTQLQQWAKNLPLVYKVISILPKWGLDFSMDYVDREGNTFEILHWEWDSFHYETIEEVKLKIEPVLLNTDWDDAGKQILNLKDQWHHLDFFAQSEWKCQYFGIPKEQFKMVIWK